MAAHRFWRLYQLNYHGLSGQAGMSELELRTTAGGENLAISAGGTASASQTYYGTAGDAFDGSTSSAWSASVFPNWIKKDFGVGNEQEIACLTIKNFSFSSGINTRDAILQWSDDDATWTNLITISNPGGAGISTTYTYTPPAIVTAEIRSPRGSIVSYFGSAAALTTPPPGMIAYGGAHAELSAPPANVVVGFGGGANLLSPPPALSATAHDSYGENSAQLLAPNPSLQAYFGGSAQLTPAPQVLLASVAGTNLLCAELSAPASDISFSATVSGTSQADIRAPAAYMVGYAGMVCSITLTGRPTIEASVTGGGISRAFITAPLFELTSSVTTESRCSADILAPAGQMGNSLQAWLIAPAGKLTAIGSAVVAVSYEAYSINLSHRDPEANDEVTRYTNFPFDRIVRYQGSYFGVAADGLYLLEGTTDDGTAIPYAIKTCIDDFKAPELKTVASAYFSGRLGPDATVTLHAGEQGQESYPYNTPRGQGAQNHREKFGRGVKNRYFAIGVAGDGALELDTIELEVNKMSRRI